ncbi:MAG: GGDEF domain-containing protein [Pseudohongiellaceae bacterium]|nr:GGDEF domain-containing protein [Pseudohongiellaceae bacterium]
MKDLTSRTPATNLEIPLILDELVNHLDAMLAFWSSDQVCLYANDAYFTWFGKTKEQVIGMTMQELLGPIYEKNLPYIEAAFAGEQQIFEREIPNPDGTIRHSLATYTPYIVNGEVLGMFAHVANVTPLKLLERELREAKVESEYLATHDFLTGLPNRVLLEDRIAQALDATRRSNAYVAIISLDLDNFKEINDTFGHIVGDKLLIEVAKRLGESLRPQDTATRMGGDEFLIVAGELETVDQAQRMAERLLLSINTALTIDGFEIVPSCSLGVIFNNSRETDQQTLISESDKALYTAKHKGKGQFVIVENKLKSEG